MSHLLLVDDDPQLRRALQINLTARGHELILTGTGEAALQAVERQRPDLVLLDLGLPDLDGIEVLARIRATSAVPVVVLTARSTGADVVAALDAGADDYLVKPFGVEVLLARVRAVLRRGSGSETIAVRLERVTIDPGLRTVTDNASREPQHLTPTEWKLLLALLAQPNALVSQRQLLRTGWGPHYETETHYLRLFMAQLRRKLEAVPSRPRHFITEPGVGYRFLP